MSFIADILLFAGALGAGLYCYVLGQRLQRFTDLETGVGGAVAVLSAQVDDLTTTLEQAKAVADASVSALDDANRRAQTAAQRLELLMASLHDLPPEQDDLLTPNPHFVRHRDGAAAET